MTLVIRYKPSGHNGNLGYTATKSYLITRDLLGPPIMTSLLFLFCQAFYPLPALPFVKVDWVSGWKIEGSKVSQSGLPNKVHRYQERNSSKTTAQTCVFQLGLRQLFTKFPGKLFTWLPRECSKMYNDECLGSAKSSLKLKRLRDLKKMKNTGLDHILKKVTKPLQ